MNVNRVLSNGSVDSISRLRVFLQQWWERVGLKAMLAPVELPERPYVTPQVIGDPAGLAKVNPFAPFMSSNAASAVSEFISAQPRSPLAVLLRPCELRTLVELQKRKRIRFDSVRAGDGKNFLITIGVDCPGTYSWSEYYGRVEWSGMGMVTGEALTYGAEEGVIPGELRPACQICDWAVPWSADITIGTFGMDPHQYLLVIARDELTDSSLALEEVTDRIATVPELLRRKKTIEKVGNARSVRRANLNTPDALRQGDFYSLLACFARCTLCTDCLDACPLYEGELSGMLGVGGSSHRSRPILVELVSVTRWLSSCSGCGMCEEACQEGIPLSRLASILSHHIRNEIQYTPGKPEKCPPWMA
ncbi:MAG: Coenzyme F420 hydrogenase/dehydrogenase, beta subunit C-terminal domain [Anaerolineales bacterium]|jgi:formate dehydrogenase subunit beta